MLLGFKDRFVLPIELGTKRQSIRRPRKRRDFRTGDSLQLQRGDRFHPVRIGTATALVVEPIVMNFKTDTVLGVTLIKGQGWQAIKTALDLDAFAVLDGFQDWADLRRFWADTHEGEHFGGNRIFWGHTFKGPLDR